MTPEERTGRIGQKCAETWASQAGITANPPLHDDQGWDVLLQLPPPTLKGTPDRAPPGTSCWVQIKTTLGTERRESIKLSNWRRMCAEPMPWFVLAIHLSVNDEPDEAFLIHVDEAWVEKGLRRLREAGADGREDLHKRTMDVTWGDGNRLGELHGRELLSLLRRHIGPDQFAYMQRKNTWVERLGYDSDDDRARRITVSFQASDADSLYEHLADLAVGLRSSYPEAWDAKVSDRRFGIEAALTEFDRRAGEMQYRVPSLGSSTLEAWAADDLVASFVCETYRAGALFPFIPDQFDKTRLVSPHMSCVVQQVTDGQKEGLSATFAFQIQGERPLRLDAGKDAIRLLHALTHHRESPVRLRISRLGGAIDYREAPSKP
jgi:hypothetical protein